MSSRSTSGWKNSRVNKPQQPQEEKTSKKSKGIPRAHCGKACRNAGTRRGTARIDEDYKGFERIEVSEQVRKVPRRSSGRRFQRR